MSLTFIFWSFVGVCVLACFVLALILDRKEHAYHDNKWKRF